LRRSSLNAVSTALLERARNAAGYTLAEMLVVVAVTGFLMASVFAIYEVTQRTTFRASGSEAALVQARAVVDKLGGDFRMVGAAWNHYSTAVTTATGTSITFKGDIDNTLDGSNNPVTLTAALAAGAASMTVSDISSIACGALITLTNGPIAETHTLPSTSCTSSTHTVNFQSTDTPFTSYPTPGNDPATDITYINTVETINWVYDSTSQKLCRKINASCPSTASSWSEDTDILADNVTDFCLTYFDRTGAALNSSCGTPSGSLSAIRAVKVSVTVKSQIGDQTITRQMELTARARTLIP
jgi:Tfp pilus assembly protein FimT